MSHSSEAWELAAPGVAGLRRVTRDVAAPGPGEVLVRFRATSLNYRDWLQVAGTYDRKQKLPMIPLSDGAGDVVAVGAGVSAFKAGDRVVNTFLPGWLDGDFAPERIALRLGGPDDGVLTTLRRLPECGLLPLPAHLDYRAGATLPCAALTAWSALHVWGRVKPGDLVVIQGTGGVSLFALQFAVQAGAEVIATSSSDAKLERVRALGAHHVINYATTPDWAAAVKRISGARNGADLIVEVAGTLEQSLRAVRAGGALALIGLLAGSQPVLNLPLVVMRQINMYGVTVGHRAGMAAMLRAMALAGTQPVIDRVFDFADAPAAFEYLASGQQFGKVVIDLP